MASSSTTTASQNLSCARCHINEADLGQALQVCGGCRSVKYCTRDCQKNDWQRHKQQCRAIQAGASEDAVPQNLTRTTMRMNMRDFMRSRSGDGQGDAQVSRSLLRHPRVTVAILIVPILTSL
jgi:hypothetical protein